MDTRHFEPEVARIDWMGKTWRFANVSINDALLNKTVYDYEFEHVFHDRENPARSAGGYISQFAKELVAQITDPEQREESEYVALLICTCTHEGCGSFVVRMEETDEHVLWFDFHNPAQEKERYHEFGSFTFDKKQFWSAVERLGSHDI